MNRLKRQVEIILDLAKRFKTESIEYHFDGSTAKVLQGEGLVMDDIDIVFPYILQSKVRACFGEKSLTEISIEKKCQLEHFHYYEGEEKVHLLFYKESVHSFYDNHIQIDLDGKRIWVKGLNHFKKNI